MEAKRLIVVGYAGNYGDVMEGRLKLSEAIRFGVEGYELEELRRLKYIKILKRSLRIYMILMFRDY